MVNKFIVIGLVVPLYFGFLGEQAFVRAAETNFIIEGPSGSIAPNNEFDVKILVSSEVDLNAYEVVLAYPSELLNVVHLIDNRSVIDIWQSKRYRGEAGTITLTGGSIQPFRGERGELISVRFKTRETGEGIFAFRTAEAYRADGKGTRASAASFGLMVRVADGVPASSISDESNDREPPRIDELSLQNDPLGGSQQILSFIAKDSESGVKQAEVRHRSWLFWSSWRAVENTAAIPGAAWTVNVRVSDNVGNLTARVIYNWPVFVTKFAVILGMVFAVAYIAVIVKNRRRRKVAA